MTSQKNRKNLISKYCIHYFLTTFNAFVDKKGKLPYLIGIFLIHMVVINFFSSNFKKFQSYINIEINILQRCNSTS